MSLKVWTANHLYQGHQLHVDVLVSHTLRLQIFRSGDCHEWSSLWLCGIWTARSCTGKLGEARGLVSSHPGELATYFLGRWSLPGGMWDNLQDCISFLFAAITNYHKLSGLTNTTYLLTMSEIIYNKIRSSTYLFLCILFFLIVFHCVLSLNIEYRSLCCTVGPCFYPS